MPLTAKNESMKINGLESRPCVDDAWMGNPLHSRVAEKTQKDHLTGRSGKYRLRAYGTP